MLEELKIEGFRSLKSVTWRPGKLNVLIGPNGGGKSNLLRTLELFKAGAEGRLRDTIFDMGGMAPLLWAGRTNRLQFALRLDAGRTSFDYQFELMRLGQSGGYEIGSDQMSINYESKTMVIKRPDFISESGEFYQWRSPGIDHRLTYFFTGWYTHYLRRTGNRRHWCKRRIQCTAG